MPPTRDHPPDWGTTPQEAEEIAARHGPKATRKALRLLQQAAVVEPKRTADFLAALPPNGSAYQLNRRVKSPESLARKIQDRDDNGMRGPIDDILRYTVVVDHPDQLVAAACHTIDRLIARGWRVRHAMHSYTDGSRYKGVHGYLEAPGMPRVEVQFHSVASLKVKELTTPWYEIERSSTASADDRAAARAKCVAASNSLQAPAGIDDLARLGGQRVAVNNYSDSQQALANAAQTPPEPTRRRTAALEKNDGVAR